MLIMGGFVITGYAYCIIKLNVAAFFQNYDAVSENTLNGTKSTILFFYVLNFN